jgi:hypothetical protein
MTDIAAVDQLATAARDEMPNVIAIAAGALAAAPDRDRALATLTVHLLRMRPAGVAAIAADALLRLAEENPR